MGTPRKRFTPTKVLPKPQVDVPTVYGVEPGYLEIGHLRVTEGRFFDANDNSASAPVCVLGAAAKDSLFGAAPAVGEYVKLNELWCHVIGIAGPQLAAILERTRESGVRRAVGSRKWDIIRQFVIEAVLISFAGGLVGVGAGFAISQLIAWLAGWSTIVTVSSILLAFLVSISVGLIFGIYPAVKAARLDPVEAIRYE